MKSERESLGVGRDPNKPFCEGGAGICDTCLDSCGRSEWLCQSEGHEWYGEPGSRSCPRCGAVDAGGFVPDGFEI